MKKIILLFVLAICTQTLLPQSFLKASGKKIVNESGQEVILRGIGLGGWLIQEGYMLQTSGFANAQWEIRAKIEALIGTAKTDEFYELYRKNMVRREDIQAIKSWGFNSIRLPLHYNLLTPKNQPNVYLESGFAIIDSCLQWCKENQIYLILDLHAAPGGQSAGNICDYNPAELSLWEDAGNRIRTVNLWYTLANRYKNEPWIGGYDVLNETAWNLGTNSPMLRQIMIDITTAIRQVDTKHIIFVEGNWYATDFGGLTPPWDNNMSYSFHKYWNGNSTDAIQYLLNIRNNTNVPLWLGESGENSNTWFTDCIKLLENNSIGWSWWTLKKLDATNSLMSIKKPAEFDQLLKYWNNQASKPTVDYAVNALNKLANNLLYQNCTFNRGVIDAMFRQVNTAALVPYAANTIPGTVFSANYDMGKYLLAYKDNDYQNTGNNGSWNSGYAYRNDGVDIGTCTDAITNGFYVGWLNAGEYMNYTVDVQQTGFYNIVVRVASTSATGQFYFRLDNSMLGSLVSVPNTGSWTTWKDVSITNVYLTKGKHTLMFNVQAAGFNVSYYNFVLVTAIDTAKPVNGFALAQNYPNPFNPGTTIAYTLEEESNVTISIYNTLGELVDVLVNQMQDAKTHELKWTPALPAGVYIYKLQAVGKSGKTFTDKKKMIFLR